MCFGIKWIPPVLCICQVYNIKPHDDRHPAPLQGHGSYPQSDRSSSARTAQVSLSRRGREVLGVLTVTGSYNRCRPPLNTKVQLPTKRAEPRNLSQISSKRKANTTKNPHAHRDSPAPAVLGSEHQRGTVFSCSVSWTAEVQTKGLPGDLPWVNYHTLINTATTTHFFKREAFFSVTSRHCIYLLLTRFCCYSKKRCDCQKFRALHRERQQAGARCCRSHAGKLSSCPRRLLGLGQHCQRLSL